MKRFLTNAAFAAVTSVLSLTGLLVIAPASVAYGQEEHGHRPPPPRKGGKKKGPEPGSKAGDSLLRRMAEFERLDRMPEDDRQRALENLPPARRQRIEEGLARYRAMDPVSRERLRRFEGMAPEQKDSIRQNFRRMQELPPNRRMMVRRELQRLRGMDPGAREGAMQSDAFRRRFDENEQSLIRETVANLPPA
ncbi:hypothetical protein F183_A15600 [Bryobacterales bacterium F-183]|nr:hypothetical protein F183_A15600 [Bryobacterales bacterium F-183]